MPQGRRKDFSGKQKKLQMQAKRDRKQNESGRSDPNSSKETIRGATVTNQQWQQQQQEQAQILVKEGETKRTLETKDRTSDMVEAVALASKTGGRNKYDLRFRVEDKAELARLREDARKTIDNLGGHDKGSNFGQFFPSSLEHPKRPKWNRMLSKSALEANEEKYFREYVNEVFDKFDGVSHFELNLETWRQLWRVAEMADVLLLVVDARYPTAMTPPSLYKQIRALGKDMIVILNKVDLIPIPMALAWKDRLEKSFPDLHVVFFTSCPTYNLRKAFGDEEPGLKYRRLRGRISMVAEGALNVMKACKAIVEKEKANVDLAPWEELIRNALEKRSTCHADSEEETVKAVEGGDGDQDSSENVTKFRDGILTLGMVGQPNAGKSSLINSLVGKRVVSVSKTPGHTKHFQTIFITKSVRLCDCPGLVFPSLVPKPLQVLMGSYPISQVREMFSVVKYLAERVDLPKLLRIQHPSVSGGDSESSWSAFDICEAWALKRGFVTARSNRPDMNRAANHILRMTLEGKITLSLEPDSYWAEEDKWRAHPDAKAVEELLQINAKVVELPDGGESSNELDSDDEDGAGEKEEEERTKAPQLSNKFSALLMEDGDDSE